MVKHTQMQKDKYWIVLYGSSTQSQLEQRDQAKSGWNTGFLWG